MTVCRQSVRRLTKSAVLAALGFVLSNVWFIFHAYGGAITGLSMLPVCLSVIDTACYAGWVPALRLSLRYV